MSIDERFQTISQKLYRESRFRSLAKTISWRTLATATTIIIVYIVFGKIELAAAVGGIETVSKLALYYFHERAWAGAMIGRKEVDPFVLWFTGMPCAGKSTIADRVAEKLEEMHLRHERVDSKDIRPLFPKEGYERDERLRYLRRIALLARILEQHGVIVVASFVSPYKEGREEVARLANNYVEVYVKASEEACRARDSRGLFERADRGDIPNFTGVSDVYEEPERPAIVLDTDTMDIEACADAVIRYVLKTYTKKG